LLAAVRWWARQSRARPGGVGVRLATARHGCARRAMQGAADRASDIGALMGIPLHHACVRASLTRRAQGHLLIDRHEMAPRRRLGLVLGAAALAAPGVTAEKVSNGLGDFLTKITGREFRA
jgi:hypothetical protein